MEAWIPIVIAAAFLQNLRSALQKHLKDKVSTAGATFARFGFGFPAAIAYLAGLVWIGGYVLPTPNWEFAFFVLLGGSAQIFATALLVALFGLRNFAVGTAYSKTETLQTALIGAVVLAESPTLLGWLAIFVGLVGILLLSFGKGQVNLKALLTGWTHKSALMGLASGALFGVSGVAYRSASLSLEHEPLFVCAALTLTCVIIGQSLAMMIYLIWKKPGELGKVIREWKVALPIGLSGVTASAGWFTALALQNAAYVRALGQIELLFTYAASLFIFKEKITGLEYLGSLLILASILIILQA
ncbi:EamA family transporter [Rhodovibrionaceae bacterium A322]